MDQDIIKITEEFLSSDPLAWSKLSSNVNTRRLQILLLREILIELRKLNQTNILNKTSS